MPAPALEAPGVGVTSNAQSAAALSVSAPFGSRSSELSFTFESSTSVGDPSTRLTGPGNPSMRALVIEPSYESASTRVDDAVSISATPSGAPFWIWLSAPGKGTESAPGRWDDGRIHHDHVLIRREAVRPQRDPRVLGPGQSVDEHDGLVGQVDRRTGAVEDLDELAVIGSDVVVVDFVEDEVRYRRSTGAAARLLCREAGPEHDDEEGHADENVPG